MRIDVHVWIHQDGDVLQQLNTKLDEILGRLDDPVKQKELLDTLKASSDALDKAVKAAQPAAG